MIVKAFYDEDTFTLTYVVHHADAKECIIIDPVLDFDPASGKVAEDAFAKLMQYLETENLAPTFVLETHAHADHLSGAQLIKKSFPHVKIGISHRITVVQELFTKVFGLKEPVDGSQFDCLLDDFQILDSAGLSIMVLPTPGHTPACSSFLIGDVVFTGDALFMPDYGVGRCDFPAGSAKGLYHSIMKVLYSLPDDTQVYTGHDCQPGGRDLKYQSTIGEQKSQNIFLHAKTPEEDFVNRRQKRDSNLAAPRLLLPSIQVNILAGKLPEPEENGVRYLKIPIKEE